MKQIKPLMQREKPTWRQFNDIEGETFGRLRVISYAGCRESPRGDLEHYWNCKCECEAEHVAKHDKLRSGNTKSCGCYHKVKMSSLKTTHGCTKNKSFSPEYEAWRLIRKKCLNPKYINYRYYGGIGISICDRWLYSFEHFLADMGARPIGMFLGRINANGNYEPNNCAWMTLSEGRKTQRKPTMRSGQKMPAREGGAA